MSYQFDMDPAAMADSKAIERFWKEQALASDDTRAFFEKLVRGVAANLPALDREIEGLLQNWRMSRIEKVDLAVLRVAAFEMLHVKDTPSAVVIDEAIELAKRFGTKDSPSFINGILDALGKRVKGA